jgi:hypothetical protein
MYSLIVTEIKLSQTRLHRDWPIGKSKRKVESVSAAYKVRSMEVSELTTVNMKGTIEFVGLFATLDRQFRISPANDRSCVIGKRLAVANEVQVDTGKREMRIEKL